MVGGGLSARLALALLLLFPRRGVLTRGLAVFLGLALETVGATLAAFGLAEVAAADALVAAGAGDVGVVVILAGLVVLLAFQLVVLLVF